MKPPVLLLLGALLAVAPPGALAQPADAVALPHADLDWVEMVPGVYFAAAHGDWSAEAHGKFIRFDPGAAAPMHIHTNAYHGVILSGRLTNPYTGEGAPPELGPGDYWYVPAGAVHSNECVSQEPCLFYAYGDAAWDIEVVEE